MVTETDSSTVGYGRLGTGSFSLEAGAVPSPDVSHIDRFQTDRRLCARWLASRNGPVAIADRIDKTTRRVDFVGDLAAEVGAGLGSEHFIVSAESATSELDQWSSLSEGQWSASQVLWETLADLAALLQQESESEHLGLWQRYLLLHPPNTVLPFAAGQQAQIARLCTQHDLWWSVDALLSAANARFPALKRVTIEAQSDPEIPERQGIVVRIVSGASPGQALSAYRELQDQVDAWVPADRQQYLSVVFDLV